MPAPAVVNALNKESSLSLLANTANFCASSTESSLALWADIASCCASIESCNEPSNLVILVDISFTEPNEPDVEDELPNELLAGEKRTDVPKDDDIKLNTELDEQDGNGELPDELLAGEKRTGDPKDDDIGLDTEPNEPDVEDELPNELLAGEKCTRR